jgi:hypothetical protein
LDVNVLLKAWTRAWASSAYLCLPLQERRWFVLATLIKKPGVINVDTMLFEYLVDYLVEGNDLSLLHSPIDNSGDFFS